MTEDQAITHFFDDFDHFFFLRQVNSILNTPDDFHFLTADGENENVFSEDNKISEWRRMAVHFQRYLQAETFFTIAFGIREFGPPWRLADRFRNAEWNEIIGKIAKKEIPEQLIGKNKINDFSEWVSHTITAKNLNNSYIDKSHIDFICAQAAFLSNRSVMNSFKHGNLAVRGTYKIEIDVPQIRDFFQVDQEAFLYFRYAKRNNSFIFGLTRAVPQHDLHAVGQMALLLRCFLQHRRAELNKEKNVKILVPHVHVDLHHGLAKFEMTMKYR